MARTAVLCRECCSHTTTRADELCPECRPGPSAGDVKFTDPVRRRARRADGITRKAAKVKPAAPVADDEGSADAGPDVVPKPKPVRDAGGKEWCGTCGKRRPGCACDHAARMKERELAAAETGPCPDCGSDDRRVCPCNLGNRRDKDRDPTRDAGSAPSPTPAKALGEIIDRVLKGLPSALAKSVDESLRCATCGRRSCSCPSYLRRR